ncbi:MAG TPA: CHAT domain-containing protein, partial [Paracoccaceae bacterium]|nr:CHAT domain-containing protein [Paracoccaceae bacterium]
GGLSVTFFMWLMHWLPHPGRTVPTFEDIAAAWGRGEPLVQGMIAVALVAIAALVALNLKSLVWNLRAHAAWKGTEGAAKFAKTNAQSQLMALPLALAVTRRVGGMIGADTATTATFLRDAATILRRMGYLDEALEAYRRIVPIFGAEGTPAADRLAAQAVFLQGDVLNRMRRYDEALAAFAEADTRATAAFGAAHHETLAVRLARARAANSVGEVAEVAQILDTTLPHVVAVFGEGSLQHGTWLVVQAWREADAAQDAAAGLATMARAVAMVAAALPATRRVLAETRSEYAVMLSYAGQHEAAWAQYEMAEPSAGHDRKFLLDVLSFRRDQGVLDEASLAVEVLPHLQRVAGGAARGAVREQVLRSLIRDPMAGQLYREATDMVEDRVQVEADIAAVAARPAAEADPAAEAALRVRLAGLAEGIRARMAEVRRLEPAFADLTGAVDLDVAGIQALLGPEDAVVLIDHQRHDQEWSVAVAITRDRAVARLFWVPVADLTGWISQIRDSVSLTLGVRAAVALEESAPGTPGAFPAEAAVALYDVSLGKVSDVIAPSGEPFKSHLYVEFRGPMTGLPPALLMPYGPDPGTPPQDLPFLLRWHAFTMLPALSALRGGELAEAVPRAPEAFAGFADPVFDAAEAEALLVASAATGGETRLRGALMPLPETAGEARAVRASVGGKDGPLWLGAEATEAQVKAADLSRFRMLYFATHGLVSGDRAGGAILAEPALALTPGQGEDGFLTATEIAQLRLNADWVVLSACNTAQGAEPGAEALSGLAQAFLYAGARGLLVSHWPVESRSAVQLMTDTFRLRAERADEPAAFALRRAMEDMLTAPPDPRWSHPAYWAPFVLVGTPD